MAYSLHGCLGSARCYEPKIVVMCCVCFSERLRNKRGLLAISSSEQAKKPHEAFAFLGDYFMPEDRPNGNRKSSIIDENLLSRSVAAKSLRVSVTTLDWLIESYGIPTVRVLGTNRTWIDGKALESLVSRSSGGHA